MYLKKQVSNNEKVFWNMMGSMSNAFSTMILLIVVNRICGEAEGGVFSIGHAVGQLMLTIGSFEVRNYQSTDIKEKYTFAEYYGYRIITCIIMLFVSVGYVLINGYDFYKALIAVLLCIYRGIDAFSDVFQGMFQQKDRIDISGKMLCLKVVMSSIFFVIALVLTQNLLVAIIIMDIVSVVCCVLYDMRITKLVEKLKISLEMKAMKEIFIECVPLFVGAFMAMYIVNEPKYAIDKYLDLRQQNIFSIIFMPAFVINLFSLFVFRPMITTMAMAWEKSDKKSFVKMLLKALVWCLALTVLGVIGAMLLGIPVLELLYGVKLKEYRYVLLLIMIGGGGNALSTVFRYSLTVVREQYKTLWVYIITLGVTLMMAKFLIQNYALWGAGALYMISMYVMTIVSAFIMGWKINKKD